MHICIYIYIHTYTYMYVHIYIHIYTTAPALYVIAYDGNAYDRFALTRAPSVVKESSNTSPLHLSLKQLDSMKIKPSRFNSCSQVGHTYIHIDTHTYYIRTCIQLDTYMYIYMYIRTYIRMYIHAYTRTNNLIA